ncbi:Ubiquitin fusion degradation protein 1 [Phytophthora nicotianae]|uniref:Ubiquitin fusion degradation protein 1 n=1 Tax=Phytophthora nicotianae TaxID=4792 RepID=A0A0W8D7Z6_PHYNI|nr:Ubiquitin fusion degradation protein 1 [Phytophthora nicotianae]
MQYNKACKLAEQLEKLSLRGDHMRQTNGVSGISGEAEAHTAATKAEMVQMIVETEQRSQDYINWSVVRVYKLGGFGAAKPAPSASPFGAATAPASSPFGATSQTSTGFGSGASGFGGFQSTATTPAFGTPSAFGTTGGFGAAGVNYREKLTAFYQQHNPAKLSSVDATLEKYKGREDHLFAMLEQKYVKKTPTAATGGFGIPSTTAFGGGSGFGAPSALGATAAPAFGSASTLGGTAQPAFGGAAGSGFGMASRMGGGFGSAAPAAPSGTTTGSGFSAFGSQTPSFGGAAQQSGGFGAGSGGLGSFWWCGYRWFWSTGSV